MTIYEEYCSMKSSVEVFLKRNALKKEEVKKNDRKHLSYLNVFLMKWESFHHQHNLVNKYVRESWCQQVLIPKDDDDDYFLHKWKHLCLEMSRESICVQHFFEDNNISSEFFNKSWSKLCRDEVRESICIQKFVQSNKLWRNFNSNEFVDVLSYFDDVIFRDWIHERGLCVVAPNNNKNVGNFSSNKYAENYRCENVS